MDIGVISMRYAKALRDYAKASDAEEQVYRLMRTLSFNLEKSSELREVLCNPVLDVRTKYSLVRVAAAGDASPCREFARFVTLLLRNRREDLLQYICLSFLSLYRKDKHIGVARLVTAVPVSEEVEARIREISSTMLHAHMELQTEVNPTIEGGFIFDIDGYRLDASIATQLKRVKQQFIQQNRRIV